jgi:hypothetical protein
MICFPNALNIEHHLLITLGSPTAPLWMLFQHFMAMVCRRCNRQFLADRLDTVAITILVNECH